MTQSPTPRVIQGQIIREYGQTLLVEAEAQIYECFSRKNIASTAVGDQVLIELSAPALNKPVIIERLARTSVLMRRDRYHPEKELAANLTQVMVVLAVEPETSELYLDQYLCAAELARLPLIIVINKIDLLSSPITQVFPWIDYYANMGYPIIEISVAQNKNLSALKDLLEGQATLMLGVSGVGKSSLLNSLTGQSTRTSDISAANQKGQHTTSTCTLYHLPLGGDLFDAPGIREFNLVSAQQSQLLYGFRDFKPYLGHCKFRNCQHGVEPGCALKTALHEGKIHPERFKNYLRILAAS